MGKDKSDAALRLFATLPASYTLAGPSPDGRPPAITRCQTRTIALDQIVLAGDDGPAPGTRVHVKIPGLGVASGQVARQLDGGFSIALDRDPAAIAKLTPRLRWLKDYFARAASNNRSHPRHLTPPEKVVVEADGMDVATATLFDLSAAGVGIHTDLALETGTRVTVGGLPGTVMRRFEGGLGIQFDTVHGLEDVRNRLLPRSLAV